LKACKSIERQKEQEFWGQVNDLMKKAGLAEALCRILEESH